MTDTVEAMARALEAIVLNAALVPDPAMNGTTDTYSVPLDDVTNANEALAAYRASPDELSKDEAEAMARAFQSALWQWDGQDKPADPPDAARTAYAALIARRKGG